MEALISEFQDCVSRQGRLLQAPSADDLRRDCVAEVLEAIGSFLISWEGLAGENDEFPSGVVRDALSLLLSEVGPDAQIRSTLLELLPALSRSDARQQLLDVLPWTLPIDHDDLEQETQKVLNVLRGVLLDDSTALLPVLGCLSGLSLSEAGRNEVWNLALKSLPVVPETDLPVLVRTLFRHIATPDDARDALDAIRNELALVEATNDLEDIDAVALVSHVLLLAFNDETNGRHVANAYIAILGDLADQKMENWGIDSSRDKDESANEGGKDQSFLLFDIVALLALYEHQTFQVSLWNVLDNLLQSDAFPFDRLKTFLKTLCHRHQPGQPFSLLYERLVPSLLSLGISLLLTPVRNYTLPNVANVLNETHDFVVELHHAVDRDSREELIHCLLHLSDESSISPGNLVISTRGGVSNKAKTEELIHKREGLKITSLAVHRTLHVLAVSGRSTVARFKNVLLGRLTATDNLANGTYTSIHHLCQILASLIEPVHADSGNGAGIDPSQLMMLLQKLLFASPHRHRVNMSEMDDVTDTDRVVRGLLLATELVRSPYSSHGDKDCIEQWVLRILLPSNGRILDPEIGPYGLQFLVAYSIWKNNLITNEGPSKSINSNVGDDACFQHVKTILSRTGLIQMKSHYEQRRKSSQDAVIGYTLVPEHYRGATDAGIGKNGVQPFERKGSRRRRTRDMVFCTNWFVRSNGMPHPSRWKQCATWIYHLVDTYLDLGQKASATNGSQRNTSKWMPDGWLLAAIEFPVFCISTDETESPRKTYHDIIQQKLGEFEICYEDMSDPVFSDSDLSKSLVGGKTLAEVRQQVDSIFRLALVCLLSISLCFAVLGNAHRHYMSLSFGCENTTEDSKVTTQKASNERRRELLQLIKYQLTKIYDLKKKCLFCAYLLELHGSAIKKSRSTKSSSNQDDNEARANADHIAGICGRSRSDCGHSPADGESPVDENARSPAPGQIGKLVSEVDLAVQQIRNVIAAQFGTTQLVNPVVLWECLSDREDDEVISQAMSSVPQNDLESFQYVTKFRRALTDHLLIVKTVGNPSQAPNSGSQLPIVCSSLLHNDMESADAVYKLGLGHCIKMISYLSKNLPKLRRSLYRSSSEKESFVPDTEFYESASIAVGTTTSILSSYVALAHMIIVSTTPRESLRNNIDESFVYCRTEDVARISSSNTPGLAACLQVCENAATHEPSKYTSTSEKASIRTGSISEILPRVFKNFLTHLRLCEDASVAIRLTDLLSVLAFLGSQKFLDSCLEASWRVLHTVYISNKTNTDIPTMAHDVFRQTPYAFDRAVQLSLDSCGRSVGTRANRRSVDKALRATVMRSALSSSREHEQHLLLKNSLLTFWGLMVAASCPAAEVFDYLSKLVDALDDLLAEIEAKSTKIHRSGDAEYVKDTQTNVHTNIRDSQTGSVKKAPFVSAIPSLTFSSLTIYFELIFHISIATFAVTSPTKTKSKNMLHHPSNDEIPFHNGSPYKQLLGVLDIFSRLLDVYSTKFKMFPKRITAMVLRACKHVLALSVHHLDYCVQWRNSQPLLSPEEKRAGVNDCGSIKYLQQMLDKFASHGAGKVLSLCSFFRSEAARRIHPRTTSSRKESDTSQLDLNGETWVFASYHKNVRSLMMAAEEVIEAIREVAYAHNLVAPRIKSLAPNQNASHYTEIKRKRKIDDHDKGFHLIEMKTDSEADDMDLRRQKRRIIPVTVAQNGVNDVSSPSDGDPSLRDDVKQRGQRRVSEEEYEWHEQSELQSFRAPTTDDRFSESSSSFGIVGDWDQTEQGSLSGSLDLKAQDLVEQP